MEKENLYIIRYTPDKQDLWDTFVDDSRNGTFLHKRAYMDYHSHLFNDHSLLFYCGEELTALLPANLNNDTIASHGGLTYGGLILNNAATAGRVLNIFEALLNYISTATEAKRLLYRPVPHIYHRYPCEEELYALFRSKAQLVERKISSTIDLRTPIPPKGRRKLTTAAKSRLHISQEPNFAPFWQILSQRLKEKYDVSPVHTLHEIELLHSRFPHNIRLYSISDNNGNILGGTLLYITNRVAHMQYAGTTDEGRRTGALDHLYDYIFKHLEPEIQYFDFGISTEEGGHYLNSGLIAYKERLGGRATMYDAYTIEIKK